MNSSALSTRVNGIATDSLAVADRAVMFGDGVFETLMVHAGKPRFWLRHMARLQAGCHQLRIKQIDEAVLRQEVDELVASTDYGECSVLKIIISRGESARGFRSANHASPTRIIQLHAGLDVSAVSEGVTTRLCTLRLGNNPALAGIKHLNRLEQVLARAEWDDEFAEGLLLDQAGRIIEGTMSNLFLVREGRLETPDLSRCGVAGITRSIVMQLAEQAGLNVSVRDISKNELFQANELFLCNSLIGIWPVLAVDSNNYEKGEVTVQMQRLLADFSEDRHVWHT